VEVRAASHLRSPAVAAIPTAPRTSRPTSSAAIHRARSMVTPEAFLVW